MVYNETLHDYSYHSVNLKGFMQYLTYCILFIFNLFLKKEIKKIYSLNKK